MPHSQDLERVPGSVLLILSGGLDSSTLLADLVHNPLCHRVETVTFEYGQRHAVEIGSAAMLADVYDVSNSLVTVPTVFTRSPLIIASDEEVPIGEDFHRAGVATTYVPRRNTVFLALAAAIAEQRGIEAVAYGAHSTDANYPDCTRVFAQAFNDALLLGSDPLHPVRLYAPYLDLFKYQVVQKAASLRVPVSLTHSCYQGLDPACGVCDTCQARIEAFRVAGFIDPIDYAIDIDWGSCSPFPENEAL